MNSRNLDPSLLIPNLAVLVFLAVGIVTDKAPLVSSRPKGGPFVAIQPAERKTEARFWQDPLDVSPPKIEEPAPCTFGAFNSVVRDIQTAKPNAPAKQREPKPSNTKVPASVLLMPVLLKGQDYPEDHEVRLRIRNAVLSGLGRAQYISVDGSYLRFVQVPLDHSKDTIDIPYEQFEVRAVVADHVVFESDENNTGPKGSLLNREHDSTDLLFKKPYKRVIVLWLDEDRLAMPLPSPPSEGGTPVLNRIDKIINHLLNDSEAIAQCDLKIIGPTNSDRLERLLESEGTFRPKSMKAMILSARATVSPAALKIAVNEKPKTTATSQSHPDPSLQIPEGNPKPKAGFVSITEKDFERPWLLERTIPTDDQMAEAILQEFDRRNLRFPTGYSPSNSNNEGVTQHVAIVAEWDSLYSRSLARYMTCRLAGKSISELQSDREAWVVNSPYVHEISYLRGLDGKTGGKREMASDSAKSEDNKKPPSSQTSVDDLERPEGQSQFDYLRRLADRLETIDTQLRRDHQHPAQIAAIGILGSDVYDKLLVMRALKKRFRQVVFFTVGLDALYLNEQEHAWTRNLIVASPFGFTTGETLQDRIPPFRDSYQTALFLSTLRALNLTHVLYKEPEKKAVEIPFNPASVDSAPRLFEIGRDKIHDISVPIREEAHDHAAHHHKSHETPQDPLHPEVRLFHPLALTWFHRSALLALFLGLLLWFRPTLTLHCLLCSLTLSGAIGWLAVKESGLSDPHNHRFWIVCLAVATPLFLAKIVQVFCATPRIRWREAFIVLLAVCLVLAVWGNTRLLTAIHFVINHHGEERFCWFDGVSIWPTNIIRFAASVCSLAFALLTWKTLQAQKLHIEKTFFKDSSLSAANVATDRTYTLGVKSAWLCFKRWIWLHQPEGTEKAKAEPALWRSYLKAASCGPRIVRLIFYLLLYFSVILLALKVGGLDERPFVPVRGAVSRALDQGFMWGAVLTYTCLLFYVFDVTFLASGLLRGIIRCIPEKGTALRECEAMHLINELASTVSRLVYFPFTALFMMIAARNSLFDAWDWPPMLLCVFGLGLLIIVITTVLLQREARRAREDSFDYVDDALRDSLEIIRSYYWQPGQTGHTPPDFLMPPAKDEKHLAYHKARVEFLRERRKQIESYQGAVFQPWHRNPIFTAILIPVGGLGSIQALEQVMRLFPN